MQVINQFKGSVTKQIGQPIWQKGYHDHIIRDEADYLRIWDYIDTNPARWREDCYCCEERWTAVDHTYLFRPWGWTAEGTYYDGEGRAFPLTGWARVAREPGRWALEGALEVRGDEPLRITNRYRLEETGSPLVLAWESHNPALGVLRGTFELAGDSIFSRYRSQDGAYEGQEVLTMRSEGLYYNAGIALHGGRRLSAWTALLTAERRDG